MKITEKLNASRNDDPGKPTFSFEFFPPKTDQGVQNLYDRMDRMYNLNPAFVDVTWNAGGKVTSKNLSNEIINVCQSVLGLETCLHLTCTNMPVSIIDKALEEAYESGCQNILALRGDPPLDTKLDENQNFVHSGDFMYAKDLVKYIKSKYGDHFCIGVAAYPEAHPEEQDIDRLLDYLKEKVDAGGDFIITQMFYDADHFIDWCRSVKAKGINVPIFPGIMPITTYASFIRRAKWSDIKIPESFLEKLESHKENDFKIRELGCELVTEMCQKILHANVVSHLHFYTMNLERATVMIMEKLNLIEDYLGSNSITCQSSVPWRKSLNPSRANETIRPIFWKNKKFNYVLRTQDWDEFPNGRWGDSKSPAFGEISLFDGSLLRHSPKKLLELWGNPSSMKDLSRLFIDYLSGKISMLPWSDTPLNSESTSLTTNLIKLNEKGILTVNSQPSVNGIKSSDPTFGWGPKNGFIYQKEYLEFFLRKDLMKTLIEKIDLFNKQVNDINTDSDMSDDLKILTFFAVDKLGNFKSNLINDINANAVTWGIFPNTEVIQPTIVEKTSFLAWKDEAFRIAEEWRLIFAENSSSEALLTDLIDNYVLVNIVDNDFVSTDRIFQLFENL